MLAATENLVVRAAREPGLPEAEIGIASHIGLGRDCNQDTTWQAPECAGILRLGRLLAVADGMGGHNGGEIASRYACSALSDYYMPRRLGTGLPGVRDLCRHLTDLVYRIDRMLRRQALKRPALADMGTTLSCLVLTARHSIIAHAGDSRIYRLRRGHLSCLTHDHTFVQEMVFEGELTPLKAQNHPLRHMLTQAVGTGEPLEIVQTHIDRLLSGDRYLLCTDGFYAFVKPDCIADQLSRESSADTIAAGLMSQALSLKPRDDVTVMVVKPQPSNIKA